MAKEIEAPRFGAGHWVTMRDTGEHVKVESWSPIADAYRVRSRKGGLQLVGHAALEDICAHPDVSIGKYWSRCPAPGCGAPLTPELSTCPRCQAPMCTCGRCRCVAKVTRLKAARKKSVARAR